MAQQTMRERYTLPDLPYDEGALEPVISGEIMSLHYHKHHQTYVNKLNEALDKYNDAEQKNDIATMIALQPAIRFNGGGHINHSIFWPNLASQSGGGGEPPEGDLAQALSEAFGSLNSFIALLSAKAVAIQGSGWGWLGYHKEKKSLEIATCANQDPLSTTGLIPLLGIDVWEHAYYLQYRNARADYVNAIWDVVNWKNVAERFQAARSA